MNRKSKREELTKALKTVRQLIFYMAIGKVTDVVMRLEAVKINKAMIISK